MARMPESARVHVAELQNVQNALGQIRACGNEGMARMLESARVHVAELQNALGQIRACGN